MSKKLQRILTIIVMLAVVVYTLYNYCTDRTTLSSVVVTVVFLSWLLFSQIRALIREWNDG